MLVGNITTTAFENGSLLNIEHAKKNDAGEYQCRFHNRIGSVTAEFEVEVTASEQNINGIVVAVFAVVLILVTIILARKMYQDKVFIVLHT